MNLRGDLLRDNTRYKRSSAIQQRAMGTMINGCNVIAQAQSGTSMMATFSIVIN